MTMKLYQWNWTLLRNLKIKDLKGKKINKVNEKKNILLLWKKKKHFAWNYRLNNMMNRRKFNVLQILLMKKNYQKNQKRIEIFKK